MFVSYAQNLEDVLLWRVLQQVGTGFYIDVGANHPIEDSVTKSFYEKGWSGINIEPLPSLIPQLQADRPRDITLGLAVGAEPGEVVLYDAPTMLGWATTSAEVAERIKAKGLDLVKYIVPRVTLAEICRQHVTGEIHFLKIDVEGAEEQVLRGMDFAQWRPWLVIVEATIPGSREVSFASWEPLLTGNGYQFAYFDGVNRYYVADEHRELLPALSVQANVFDDYRPYRLIEAVTCAAAREEDFAKIMAAREEEVSRMVKSYESALSAMTNAHHSEAEKLAGSYQSAIDNMARSHQSAIDTMAHSHQSAIDNLAHSNQSAMDNLARSHQGAMAALESGHLRANAAQEQLLRRTQADMRQREKEFRHEIERRENAHRRLQALREEELIKAAQWATGLEQRLIALHKSSSWRVTAPLRWLGRQLQRLGRLRPRRIARSLMSNRIVRGLLLPIIQKYPRLDRFAQRFSARVSPQAHVPAPTSAGGQSLEVPNRLSRILADLQHACAD